MDFNSVGYHPQPQLYQPHYNHCEPLLTIVKTNLSVSHPITQGCRQSLRLKPWSTLAKARATTTKRSCNRWLSGTNTEWPLVKNSLVGWKVGLLVGWWVGWKEAWLECLLGVSFISLVCRVVGLFRGFLGLVGQKERCLFARRGLLFKGRRRQKDIVGWCSSDSIWYHMIGFAHLIWYKVLREAVNQPYVDDPYLRLGAPLDSWAPEFCSWNPAVWAPSISMVDCSS